MKVPESYHAEVDALRKRAEQALEQFKDGEDMYFVCPEIQTVADELAALDAGSNLNLSIWAKTVADDLLACIGSSALRLDEPMDKDEETCVRADICEALANLISAIDSPETT